MYFLPQKSSCAVLVSSAGDTVLTRVSGGKAVPPPSSIPTVGDGGYYLDINGQVDVCCITYAYKTAGDIIFLMRKAGSWKGRGKYVHGHGGTFGLLELFSNHLTCDSQTLAAMAYIIDNKININSLLNIERALMRGKKKRVFRD